MAAEREFTLQIRVRYQETDGQGRVHHANFLTYFEQARVEMLRAAGHSYKQLEADGLMLVVAEASMQYLLAAEYDDLLDVYVRTVRARGARGFSGAATLFSSNSTMGCVATSVSSISRGVMRVAPPSQPPRPWGRTTPPSSVWPPWRWVSVKGPSCERRWRSP